MAHVQRRNGKWQAAVRGPDRKEKTATFARKVDAEDWITKQRSAMLLGTWVDPIAGRETVAEYFERWALAQPWRPQTERGVRGRFDTHVIPFLGPFRLSALRRSDLQGWVAGRSKVLAPGTVQVLVQNVRSLLNSAVADRLIATSPAAELELPKREDGDVVPFHPDEVTKLAAALPARYTAALWLAAGSGLRQGELFGLTVDRVDFLRRTLRVDRQMVSLVGHLPTWGPTKNPQSNRSVPLAASTVEALSAHLTAFPPTEATGLIFAEADGSPITRNNAGHIWRRAKAKAGLRAGQRSGWHDCRHFYASVLIRAGLSPREVAARLGHKDAVTTLRVYSHLWPTDDDRTRQAVEDAFSGAIPAAVEDTGA